MLNLLKILLSGICVGGLSKSFPDMLAQELRYIRATQQGELDTGHDHIMVIPLLQRLQGITEGHADESRQQIDRMVVPVRRYHVCCGM